jgi:ABC-type sugar transport system ATPase subunit
MVFQSYALYPHMTVFRNISYPLKLQKVPKEEMQKRSQRVADMMGIGHLMDRKPAQLSGGQQQRVALGRALVKEPSLLLFDEPLSNLDARLRLSMRGEIKRLQMELGITSIYVTHDQVEAMTMADRVAVMRDGKLQAYAPPDELYDQPRTLFIGGFVGNPPMNFWKAEVIARDGGYYAQQAGLEVRVPADRGVKAASRGEIIVGVRPEDVTLVDDGVPGDVYVVEPLGRDDLLDVRIGETSIRVLADPTLNVRIGDTVRLSFNTDKIQFFDPETEESLLWA